MINYFKSMDIKVYYFLNDNFKNNILDKIMPPITALGNGGFIWILISAVFLLSSSYRIYGFMMAASLILVTILGEGIIKHIIKRSRPFVNLLQDKLLVKKPITYSFPSGHTSSSFAAASIMMMINIRLGIMGFALASLIAFSRIYLKVHYFTDVVMGIVLGILCSKIVMMIF